MMHVMSPATQPTCWHAAPRCTINTSLSTTVKACKWVIFGTNNANWPKLSPFFAGPNKNKKTKKQMLFTVVDLFIYRYRIFLFTGKQGLLRWLRLTCSRRRRRRRREQGGPTHNLPLLDVSVGGVVSVVSRTALLGSLSFFLACLLACLHACMHACFCCLQHRSINQSICRLQPPAHSVLAHSACHHRRSVSSSPSLVREAQRAPEWYSSAHERYNGTYRGTTNSLSVQNKWVWLLHGFCCSLPRVRVVRHFRCTCFRWTFPFFVVVLFVLSASATLPTWRCLLHASVSQHTVCDGLPQYRGARTRTTRNVRCPVSCRARCERS